MGLKFLQNLTTTSNREKELILNTIFSQIRCHKIVCNHTFLYANSVFLEQIRLVWVKIQFPFLPSPKPPPPLQNQCLNE